MADAELDAHRIYLMVDYGEDGLLLPGERQPTGATLPIARHRSQF